VTARARTIYRCTNCGADHAKWAGRCDVCGEWNTLVEEVVARKPATTGGSARRVGGGKSLAAGGQAVSLTRLRDVRGTEQDRWRTGIDELDFVLGGGIVPGSMVLVGGEPGIGKSTLLLQTAALMQGAGRSTVYVSGEESPLQVKLRADRLEVDARDVALLGETLLENIIASVTDASPAMIVVDSIQTIFTADLEGAPGNVGQVRECAARLMRLAKETGTTVFVVGHVTKGGGIAGPKTLEHIVDTVLYFEGEGTADHRILRATKNRFGSVDEIGVFRMTQHGLVPVANPSELFLADRSNVASGSAVTALLEGTRPVLVEVQGLAAKAGFGTPQRVSTGYDARRLAPLLAVLDKRAKLSFAQLDVFLNVVGGIRMQEPAGDLAVAVSLA
jgi:DNA repair protein RadA/Sms